MNEDVVHFDIYSEFCKTVNRDVKYSEEYSKEFNDLYFFHILSLAESATKILFIFSLNN